MESIKPFVILGVVYFAKQVNFEEGKPFEDTLS